ncbi:triose-phosphate isomerase [Shewanella xiamenensis]|uniref:Triosephosphate isomerase n=9 Tax=Shewanella TaxID=22 RepID=TPIS_SHEON|nr:MULTISPECIES: triose-phosphate isomerase [Shewanella]A0KTZ2.1 RecName: Full=Triosephosphate isomerase; Short=TIM; Short=TPI; AltName: Full=Triose-phosphate isomerase [Shewanella sp. ANA-3]Q0HXR9.1 RecName: Full=Triosephosphate isomerase; Short=TIM; Short=TPI; AltName: Full=Triose-phosphate isomerase [Shewanella sp. MR-7]Q8EHL9.1 RecName: Full=Triosephosphate isomerase; Short=TIM; Short=TPI; AltName: Full=Triose-phosphate isomerase [Shewanella oneidensis MR-1]QXN24083.1 triose-phosphate isome
MALRRPMVAGNWKMNGSAALAQELFKKFASKLQNDSAEVVLCPPSIYLESVRQLLEANKEALDGSLVRMGAQNLSQHDFGAYTGEVSGQMLKDCGCRYVIIGHSERRRMYGETSNIVAEKFAAAQKHGLTPILCVGESGPAREARRTFEVIAEELDIVIQKNGTMAFDNAIIAYEPLWAVGTGKSATPEQAQEVHAFIRKRLSEVSPFIGENIRILYGGSVTPSNAADLFAQPDVDGGLIGGASLNSTEFLSLCTIAMSA